MLYTVLHSLAEKLSDHLKLALSLNDDIVALGPIDSSVAATPPNKMLVTLMGIERETGAGIKFNVSRSGSSHFGVGMPAWQLNVYVVISAVFVDKQYEQGLQVLSHALNFIQSNKNIDIPESDAMFAIEPVNVTLTELSNLWGVCGGTYFPSVFCKIRVLSVDGREISVRVKSIDREEHDYGVK